MPYNVFRRLIGIMLVSVTLINISPLQASPSTLLDSDHDGLSDDYERKIGSEIYLADTDGDGIADGQEIGANKAEPLDTDGDHRINILDYDDDNDGLPSILESKVDTDHDGIPNHLDKDSDNDGVSDGVEAGMVYADLNHDDIDDAFNLKPGDVDINGDGINDHLVLPDHNHNGVPDYLDASYVTGKAEEPPVFSKEETKESVNIKPINHPVEIVVLTAKKPKKSAPKKGIIIKSSKDSDNDGLLDTQEIALGTNPNNRDTDGDKVSDAIEIGLDINKPQDTDNDGIIDALDTDDDNDGVLTKQEDLNHDGTPINDDTDDNGIPNYLDNNDDGDSLLTIAEGQLKDSDKDGVLDYLDNNGLTFVPPAVELVDVKQDTIPIDTAPRVVVIGDVNKVLTAQTEVSDEKSEAVTQVADTPKESLAEFAINEVTDTVVAPSKKPAKQNKPQTGVIAWITSLWQD